MRCLGKIIRWIPDTFPPNYSYTLLEEAHKVLQAAAFRKYTFPSETAELVSFFTHFDVIYHFSPFREREDRRDLSGFPSFYFWTLTFSPVCFGKYRYGSSTAVYGQVGNDRWVGFSKILSFKTNVRTRPPKKLINNGIQLSAINREFYDSKSGSLTQKSAQYSIK